MCRIHTNTRDKGCTISSSASGPQGRHLRRVGGTVDHQPVDGRPCTRPLAGVLARGEGWAAPRGALVRWHPDEDGLVAAPDAPRHTVHLAASPGGAWLALAGHQRVQRRLRDGTLISEHGVPHGIRTVAISDGGRLLLGGGDARTWVGPLEPGAALAHLATHSARVTAAAWIDEQTFVTGDARGVLVRVRLETGQARRVGRLGGAVTALGSFGAEATAAGDAAGRVVIWPEPGATPVGLKTSLGSILGMCPAGEGALWVAGAATALRLGLDGQVTARVPVARNHRAATGLLGVEDGRLWTRSQDGLWAWPVGVELGPWWGHTAGVRAVLSVENGVWTGDRGGHLRVWDPERGTQRAWVPTGRAGVQALADGGEGRVIFGTTGGELGVASSEQGVCGPLRRAHEGPVTVLRRLALAAGDPPVLLSGGADGRLCAWDAELAPLHAAAVHDHRLRCMAVAPGTGVLTGSYDGQLALSRPLSGEVLLRVEAHERPVTGCLLGVGAGLVSGSLDGTVRSWGRDGRAVATCEVDADGVVSLVALPGDRVLVAGRGGVVVLLQGSELVRIDRLDLGRPLDTAALVGSDVLVSDQRGGLHRLAVGVEDPGPEA